MIFKCILIIMILGFRYDSGVAVTTQEFDSVENCLAARNQIVENAKDRIGRVSAFCVAK